MISNESIESSLSVVYREPLSVTLFFKLVYPCECIYIQYI